MARFKGFGRFIALAALAALVAVGLFLPNAGRYLIASDPFEQADVAVILAGLPTSRTFAARDLYRQGRVGEIWILPEPVNKVEGEVVTDAVKHDLIRLGLFQPDLPQWAERILLASGVPKSQLLVLPKAEGGTMGEAPQARAAARQRHPKSLVIITSKTASRRARFIFRHMFKKEGIAIYAYPTPYDPFNPDRWWSMPRTALDVVMEYEKFVINAVAAMLQPAS